jgi:hypothetical protein
MFFNQLKEAFYGLTTETAGSFLPRYVATPYLSTDTLGSSLAEIIFKPFYSFY